jgi:hypothetical protein
MWQSGSITSNTLYWFEGAESWQPLVQLASMLDRNRDALRQQTQRPTQARLNKGDIICPNPHCGYVGPPKKEARGSVIVTLFLCFLFLLPGLI